MRKSFFVLGFLGIMALVWYLFIKPYDYKVSFNVATYPGTINQMIKMWNRPLENMRLVGKTPRGSLKQEIVVGKHTYQYTWDSKLLNDSVTKVEVGITEPGHKLINKITIPFLETDIEHDAKNVVTNFYDYIKEHLRITKVEVEGISTFERTFCVYIPLRTAQIDKATGMMKNYSLLTSFVIENNLHVNGKPIIEIKNWHVDEDTIQYNFCFPIVKTDTLPQNNKLKYKWLEQTKAIKAVYNGNYITSDRAWYALKHYAEKNKLKTTMKPIEVFYNNPNLGLDEIKWKAEIFLPLK